MRLDDFDFMLPELKLYIFLVVMSRFFIEKILKHCNLWKEPIPRPPPKIVSPIESTFDEPEVDYSFFDTVCA